MAKTALEQTPKEWQKYNPYQFYAAVAAVTSLSPEIKIDLVDLDSCHSELRTVIEQEGVEL
ncbi:MAG: hypothetical protein P8Y03_05300 [Anaerolineales bacterium]|jgi:hypothetical protein